MRCRADTAAEGRLLEQTFLGVSSPMPGTNRADLVCTAVRCARGICRLAAAASTGAEVTMLPSPVLHS